METAPVLSDVGPHRAVDVELVVACEGLSVLVRSSAGERLTFALEEALVCERVINDSSAGKGGAGERKVD